MASDGAPRDASDKTHRYEQLRARGLDGRRAPIPAVSVVVITRQGMGAWMQLDDLGDDRDFETIRSGSAPHRIDTSAPEHAELLTMLTSLVLNCNRQESA